MQPVVRRVAARVRVLGCVGLHPAELPLEQTFKNREELNSHVVNELRRVGVEWGIECTRYEVKDIDPPLEIMSAMKVRRCDAVRWVGGWMGSEARGTITPTHPSFCPSISSQGGGGGGAEEARRDPRQRGRAAGVPPCVTEAIVQPCVTEAIALCTRGCDHFVSGGAMHRRRSTVRRARSRRACSTPRRSGSR